MGGAGVAGLEDSRTSVANPFFSDCNGNAPNAAMVGGKVVGDLVIPASAQGTRFGYQTENFGAVGQKRKSGYSGMRVHFQVVKNYEFTQPRSVSTVW